MLNTDIRLSFRLQASWSSIVFKLPFNVNPHIYSAFDGRSHSAVILKNVCAAVHAWISLLHPRADFDLHMIDPRVSFRVRLDYCDGLGFATQHTDVGVPQGLQ